MACTSIFDAPCKSIFFQGQSEREYPSGHTTWVQLGTFGFNSQLVNPPGKRLQYFFIPRDFGKLPPYLGRGLGHFFRRGFGRRLGRKNASDIFASLGIPGAIAWHVGWKIHGSIVINAGNHAKISGPKIKILRFAFERHVPNHFSIG